MADLQPGQTLGKYRLERLLGRGGMGVVWLARQSELNRFVALKFVQLADAQDLKRFEREAQTAAGLNHPNIAQVYEIGEIDGRRYLAMQFIAGRTLADAKGLPARRVAEILRDAALGLEAAHRQGVIHRDVKPQNVMLDDAGRVFVMDFGLARSVEADSSLTASGMMVGTPSYMSPEQAQGRGDIDARADIYALGATMYELITGRRAFDGDNVMSIVLRVVSEEPPAPRKLSPRVHADLETICLKAMDKERERRYASAREFADDLQRYLDGEPIQATPPTLMTVLTKKFRKNRGLFIAGSAAVLIAVAAAAFVIGGEAVKRREVSRLVALGDDALAKGDVARAKEHFDQALGLSPHHAGAMERAAKCKTELDSRDAEARRLKEREDARKAALGPFESGRKTFDDAFLLLYKRGTTLDEVITGFRKAQEHFTEALRRDPVYAEALVYRGRAHVEMYALEAALRDFGEALKIAPDLPTARYWRGRARIWALGSKDSDVPLQGLSSLTDAEAQELKAGAMDDLRRALVDLAEPEKEELIRGWMDHLEGDYERVVARMETLLKVQPRLEDAHELKGRALFALERNEEALASYEALVGLQPNHVEGLKGRATMFFQMGRIEECEKAWSSLIDYAGPLPEALMGRGICRIRLGRRDEGFAEVKQIYDEAVWDVRRHIYMAMALGDLGRLDEAVAEIDKLVKAKPDLAMGRYNRAKVLMRGGRHAEAIADFDWVARKAPDDPDVLYHRGLCLYAVKRYRDAVADFTGAMRILKRNVDVLMTRGLCYWELGQVRQALDDVSAAIESKPRHVDARMNRGNMRIKTADFAGAVEDFDVAIEVAPNEAEAYARRGWALGELGRREEAIRSYDAAVRLEPQEAEWVYGRGKVREAMSDLPGAEADFAKAADLAPDRDYSWTRLGILRMKRGDREKAVAAFDRAIALNPENSAAIGNRGILNYHLGKWQASFDDLKRAVQLDPSMEGQLGKWRDRAAAKLKEE